MARRWEPERDKPVSPKESIGRRLFEEPMLVGAKDQKPKVLLDYRLFEETRPPFEVSLDRLGPKDIDEKVASFLGYKSVRQGESRKPPKTFFGWQHICADLLANPKKGSFKFPVSPSPVKLDEPDDPEHNPYHAHVSPPIDGSRTCEPMTVALYLQVLFSQYGKHKPWPKKPNGSEETPSSTKDSK